MRLRGFAMIVALAIAAISASGCGNSRLPHAGSNSEAAEVYVYAAASLADSLKQVEQSFEAKHPDINITLNIAASGTLQRQIEQGAPADVFISASTEHMDALIREGLINPREVHSFLGNELVVVVPKGTKPAPASIKELAGKEFAAVAIGQPETVPAGLYAKQALEFNGQWETISKKLVFGKDVRSVLTFVETGNAEAGFVYRTDALESRLVRIAFMTGTDSHKPIEYPAAVVGAAKHKEEAALFIEYLQEEEAMSLFTDKGFTRLSSSGKVIGDE